MNSLHIFYLLSSIALVFIFICLNSSNDKNLPEYSAKNKAQTRSNTIVTITKGNVTYREVEENVFLPMGYKIESETVIPTLSFVNQPQCSLIFKEWLAGSGSQNESATPPKSIPSHLLDQYSMKGYADIQMIYMDDRSGIHEAKWEKSTIDEYVDADVTKVANYDGEGRGLYHAMKAYGIKDQSGIIIGSLSPWVEAFAIRLGAAKIKTLEYMKILTPIEYPWMSAAHPIEIANDYENHLGAYDFAASFSSLEHSGLGRFGDALDPIGDIKESLKVYCMLKEGGLFFLAVGTGIDITYFNIHRNYGRIRLALMAAGFDIVDMFLIDERVLITPEFFANGHGAQPVLVLRKRYSKNIYRNKS